MTSALLLGFKVTKQSVYKSRGTSRLKGLTPYEYICKIWTAEPERFRLDPIHQMPGLNSYATEFGMIAAKGLAQIDALVERFSTNEEIPGIGPITALTLASQVSPQHFKSSRHFASWVGLAPRENSTGGKARLGKISKVGNERIRQLLVVGVMAIIQRAKPDNKKVSPWLLNLLSRRPKKVVAVALANKMARTAWAMMMSGESYRHQPQAA
jgi:hypothetical protein